MTLRAGVWQSCYDDPADAAGSTQPAPSAGWCPRGGSRGGGRQESVGQTQGCFAIRARGLSPSSAPIAAPAPCSRWRGAAKGTLSIPLGGTAVGARRGWGWLSCTGGCRKRDPSAGQRRGAGVNARGELSRDILGAGQRSGRVLLLRQSWCGGHATGCGAVAGRVLPGTASSPFSAARCIFHLALH